MRPGPTTFRPDAPVAKTAGRMRERGATDVLVTTPDGRLIGLFRHEDGKLPSAERT